MSQASSQIGQKEFNLFIRAAESNNVDAMQDYIRVYGAAILHAQKDVASRQTALCVVSGRCSAPEAFDFLLKMGADTNKPDDAGWTPLMLAALFGRTDCLPPLLQHGAQLNWANLHGSTALHVASREGRASFASCLLAAGALSTAQYSTGMTPLMLAVINGNVNCVNALLAWGAVLEMRSQDGYTAADYARTVGFGDIADMLDAHNLKVQAQVEEEVAKLHQGVAMDEIAKTAATPLVLRPPSVKARGS